MKHTFGILLALLVLGLGFNGFGQTEVEATGVDGPLMKLDKDIHDYGTIEQGADGECFFTVTNVGNQPLIISNCKKSCGCTVPTCPKEPIAPGATTKIKVKYDTNRVGPINKSVTISSNAVNQPTKIIRIKGNIKAKTAGTAPEVDGVPTNK